MRILLVDADSTIPNLALMKLSQYYKSMGATVELQRLGIPYYPWRIKKEWFIDTNKFDKVFCSVIFDGNKDYVRGVGGGKIIFGGTGYSLKESLKPEIENQDCDYSIYPENDISYGFLSRGCIRNCKFCKVRAKEGWIRQVSTIDKIVRHKKVKFLDNNFLALCNHKTILQELIDKNTRCQFNQGLDVRLIDDDNSLLLSKLNYMGEYIFAFDSYRYKDIIEQKLQILNLWRKKWQLKFFVYISNKMPLSDTIKRIELLRECYCLPYIMRDINCWDSVNSEFYIDVASWCNQPSFFKKLNFEQFLNKRHTKINRVEHSLELYNNNL